jgi:4-aminobutyrate aminotransferase / (S)-3-amino-2-methylpropionate transaminase / 5-aminovalerate transaminase
MTLTPYAQFMVKTKNRSVSHTFSARSLLKEGGSAFEPHSLGGLPLRWHKARDYSVYDEGGNKWIDMTSGIFLTNSGHSNPDILKALRSQLNDELIFAYQYPCRIREKFLQKLIGISPDHLNKAVLMNTGSEATDIAYKLMKLWGKQNQKKYIITFEGNYHGRALGSDLLGGTPASTQWSNVIDPEIVFLKFPFSPNEPLDVTSLPPLHEIAAFFLETYQGWGSWFYPDHYIHAIYDMCRDNNILFCVDEIQSGFYRMGPLYGYMTYGSHLKPDLICVGKGLTSSLPLSAVLSRAEIIDIDPEANLSGSHAGNALCCAAGHANLNFLSSDSFQNNLKEKIPVFMELNQRLSELPLVKQVNVRGLVSGIITENSSIATEIVLNLVDAGILPVWTHRNSIKLGPPLTITIDAIKEAMDVIHNTIKELGP